MVTAVSSARANVDLFPLVISLFSNLLQLLQARMLFVWVPSTCLPRTGGWTKPPHPASASMLGFTPVQKLLSQLAVDIAQALGPTSEGETVEVT